ncbi:uncharacterized protein LOC142356651 [Convolutriloba macropyga]|uniref:uncharacterized protein LOC142356651 n=1 Tax=Convolutriloba macropyga TaxID=536237 RepID=UPI003F523CBD
MKEFAMNTKLTDTVTETTGLDVTSQDVIADSGALRKGRVNVVSVKSMLLVWLYYPDDVGFYWDFTTYEYLLKHQNVLECCKMSVFRNLFPLTPFGFFPNILFSPSTTPM